MRMLIPFRQRRRRGRHSKKRQSWMHHLREYIWPSMGLLPFLRWTELRIKRERGAQHKVALGFAIGMFVSMFPIIGQMFVSMVLGFLLGANVVVAVISSFIGNPWTFPFFWAWDYKLGNWILGVQNPPPFPETGEFMGMLSHLGDVWWSFHFPTLVGAVPTGIVAAVLAYIFARVNIYSYHRARQAFLRQRRQVHMEHWRTKKTLPPRHERKCR